MNFIEVARVDNIPAGSMLVCSAGDKKILVSNIDGKFYAIDNTCTHMGGDLSKGKLEGKTITCPRHRAQFDVTSGECISGPKLGIFKPKGKNTRSYEIKIEGNNINLNI
jgi:3-phenylpropionate/trans-cinnamate dioxygenase ferredoxin component